MRSIRQIFSEAVRASFGSTKAAVPCTGGEETPFASEPFAAESLSAEPIFSEDFNGGVDFISTFADPLSPPFKNDAGNTYDPLYDFALQKACGDANGGWNMDGTASTPGPTPIQTLDFPLWNANASHWAIVNE